MRIASASLAVFDLLRLGKFDKTLFENSSKGRRFNFDQTSKFRFTNVAMDRSFVDLFFRSGDLKAMYENVKRWAQAMKCAFGCMNATINLENSIAVWIRAAFGILFNTVVCAFSVWINTSKSLIRSTFAPFGWLCPFEAAVLAVGCTGATGIWWPADETGAVGCWVNKDVFLAMADWISWLVWPTHMLIQTPYRSEFSFANWTNVNFSIALWIIWLHNGAETTNSTNWIGRHKKCTAMWL